MKRVLASSVAVAIVLFGSFKPAEAASIKFTFNCTILNTNPATCTPGGPFGSLTLTDSTVNPNRVDLDITIFPPLPAGVTGLDEFYLNYNNAVTVGGAVDRTFGLVSQFAAPGVHTSAGDVDINFNTLGPFQTTLDISVDPNGAPGLTYAGSLVVYSTLSGHAESNLDVSMFNFKDANNLFYAAFNTLPANENQQYGATIETDMSAIDNAAAVPEPASLLLLGTGMFGLARHARRRRQ